MRKGFTLIEIIVVLVIMTILAVVAIPNFTTYIKQGQAMNAQNNLYAVYNAEKTYYLNHGSYCTYFTSPACNNLTNINSSLVLNLQDPYFTYACYAGFPAPAFQCYAWSNADSHFILEITNGPIVSPG
ncbi:MAG: type II secretion system protein [Candidatus Omnitrophica bacterium]|nr:type II secretion system protein [Candidatus Omnitrophota bacterium]MDE2223094.1 type II secretion system protein [Candidatus Omnitrophota bacterium]